MPSNRHALRSHPSQFARLRLDQAVAKLGRDDSYQRVLLEHGFHNPKRVGVLRLHNLVRSEPLIGKNAFYSQ
jgi:hypothetical protein